MRAMISSPFCSCILQAGDSMLSLESAVRAMRLITVSTLFSIKGSMKRGEDLNISKRLSSPGRLTLTFLPPRSTSHQLARDMSR